MSSPPKTLHVLIIGAGISGLVLAQALRKAGISYEVFERDQDDDARLQGWAITLNDVFADLEALMPEDMGSIETCSVSRNLGGLDEAAVWDAQSGRKVVTMGGVERGQKGWILRVTRSKLRGWLNQNLPIRWNKRFTKFEEDDTGITAYFEDGTSAKGDVLVGADGASSKVRQQLLGEVKGRLNDLYVGNIMGELRMDKVTYERQMELGRTYRLVYGPKCVNFVGLRDVDADRSHAEMYWSLAWNFPEGKGKQTLDWMYKASRTQRFEKAMELTDNTVPQLREILELTGEKGIIDPPWHFRDFVPSQLPRGRATLTGDSAHAMAPFRGVGAVTAMKDCFDLVRLLINAKPSVDMPELLKKYEGPMIERGRGNVYASRLAAKTSDGRVQASPFAGGPPGGGPPGTGGRPPGMGPPGMGGPPGGPPMQFDNPDALVASAEEMNSGRSSD